MEYSEDGLLESVSADGAKTRYRYDASAQMVEAAGPRGVNSWTYDAAGRLTRERVDGVDWERTYDAAGRLIGASSDKGDAVAYAYDRSGRRTGEKRSDGSRRDYEWTGLWTLSGVTDHGGGTDHSGGGDPVVRTTTLVDALGQLSRVDDEELFFDDATGGLLQAGDRAIVHAGPLTACGPDGWLEPPAWRPGRDTAAANPYLPPAARASLGRSLGLGAGGELRVAGMEWLGARVLDPASRSFLSPDPVEPTAGAGWAANPYSYAGNNPVNLYDPAGLHPITAEELDAYRKANSPKVGTLLAIAAGVGLAFLPGAQGLAAALITGAVLGGGADLVDQWFSGYPIDWKQVGLSTVLGVAGGGIGYGAGKAFEWAAKTPLGQRVIGWGLKQARRIPYVRRLSEGASEEYTSLASQRGTEHILDGQPPTRPGKGYRGGHRWPGLPGKTPFPRDWSDARIMNEVSDIACDPTLTWIQQGGVRGASTYKSSGNPVRFRIEATRSGVPIRVIVEPGGDGIITGFPTQWSPLEATRGEIALRNEFSLATSSLGGD